MKLPDFTPAYAASEAARLSGEPVPELARNLILVSGLWRYRQSIRPVHFATHYYIQQARILMRRDTQDARS